MKKVKTVIDMITERANKMNEKFFDNELDISNIIFIVSKRMTSSLGSYRREYSHNKLIRQYIKISNRIIEGSEEWKNTLLHELIHAWQELKGYTDSHGKSFKRKAYQISLISDYKITRERKIEIEFKMP